MLANKKLGMQFIFYMSPLQQYPEDISMPVFLLLEYCLKKAEMTVSQFNLVSRFEISTCGGAASLFSLHFLISPVSPESH